MTALFDLLHAGETDLIACADACLVIVVERLSAEGLEALARGMDRLARQHGTLCSLCIIQRQGPITSMGPERRRVLANIMRKYSPNTSGAAVVFEGTGFRATALRSMVTAIHMASFAKHPSKVFATTEPALDWLERKHPAEQLDATRLAEAVSALRARLHEQRLRAAAAHVQPA